MEQESPLQTEATPRSFPRANRSPLDTTPSGCSERLCRPRCSFSDHTASCPVFLVNQVPVLVLPEFVTLRSRAEPPPHTPLPTRLPFPSCPPPPPRSFQPTNCRARRRRLFCHSACHGGSLICIFLTYFIAVHPVKTWIVCSPPSSGALRSFYPRAESTTRALS